MNVLWLNAGLLLPLDKGGKLRTWHLMTHLARRHAITYLSFGDPGQRREDVDGMYQVCDRLVTVPRREVSKGSARFYLDAGRFLLNSAPYAVAKYRSDEYAETLRRVLRDQRYDLIVCDFLPPVVNLPTELPCPSVLFTHNVEAEIWRRHVEAATHPVKRALLGTQWQRMLRFEGRALERFDLVLTVSDADRRTFERLYPAPGRQYHVVPTGVDTDYFRPVDPQRAGEATPVGGDGRGRAASVPAGEADGLPQPSGASAGGPSQALHLVFTGSMDWLPNEDAMLYFCREILPRIRQVEPAVTLGIVGRAPTPAVRRLAEGSGIEVTGRVEDVRPHVAAAAVYIVPLRIGGGTRLKIFEAMAMAKAVVSTAVGAEGLPVTHGRDILIADEPARFTQAVLHLLRAPAERRRLETAARALVVERYDWSAVARELETALTRAAGRTDVPAPRPGAAPGEAVA